MDKLSLFFWISCTAGWITSEKLNSCSMPSISARELSALQLTGVPMTPRAIASGVLFTEQPTGHVSTGTMRLERSTFVSPTTNRLSSTFTAMSPFPPDLALPTSRTLQLSSTKMLRMEARPARMTRKRTKNQMQHALERTMTTEVLHPVDMGLGLRMAVPIRPKMSSGMNTATRAPVRPMTTSLASSVSLRVSTTSLRAELRSFSFSNSESANSFTSEATSRAFALISFTVVCCRSTRIASRVLLLMALIVEEAESTSARASSKSVKSVAGNRVGIAKLESSSLRRSMCCFSLPALVEVLVPLWISSPTLLLVISNESVRFWEASSWVLSPGSIAILIPVKAN
mmetsp:Transcript_29092/g.48832  ORF Transcript_29092/g.48832 Transcript_29092/m.48832 type:complete len:343 (-) Transcript_29092:758-1786(-)